MTVLGASKHKTFKSNAETTLEVKEPFPAYQRCQTVLWVCPCPFQRGGAARTQPGPRMCN